MEQISAKERTILTELFGEHLEIEGDVVEFGCYRGDTSLLFQEILRTEAPKKRLWLYDSFEGLPEKTTEDVSVAGDKFRKGELAATKKGVIDKFRHAGLRVPIIKKGYFEDLDAEKDVPEKICFGFLDGDLYQSIKTSLHLCYPRLSQGGVLVVHDYNNPELPGATRAVEEFLRGHELKLQTMETLAILS
ncbi:MAG: TylF/MycF/NovP-related O-methyltransferase [Candidatus Saccharibacteria bacterium]|nr:TylF/MycF/NovP-related O-methyltransferase [Candidatus Saccharibacteria bacterium]